MKGVVYMIYQDPKYDDPNKVYIVAEGENFEPITQFSYANGDRTENQNEFDKKYRQNSCLI